MAGSRSRRNAVSSLSAVAAVAVIGWHTPSLHIEVTGARAVVHLESLGGDPADLRYIELGPADRDESIWRVIARQGSFRLRSVKLAVGANASALEVDAGRPYTVEPESAPTFMLAPRAEYRLHVCPGAIVGLCRSERFTLGN